MVAVDDARAAYSPLRPRRMRRLPVRSVMGLAVPVALSGSSRLLGLALLERGAAGAGLLIPRCRSVHTFGMRFALDVLFLDRRLMPLRVLRSVPPRRVVRERRAWAVLELPAGTGE